MTSPKTAILFGDGRMAAQCASIISRESGVKLAGLVTHEQATGWTSSIRKALKGIDTPILYCANVNQPDVVEFVASASPDIIFNVNSLDIIRDELLDIPRDGIINFHNGPLPGYRGVNIPSWAIINGEKEHGVSWHYVERAVDAGDVVASSSFALAPDETAISLNFKCIETGVALFEPLLREYLRGDLVGVPQEGAARYYPKSLTPFDGHLDFDRRFAELDALVRGLSFHPFPNEFTSPKVRLGDDLLVVGELSLVRERRPDESWTPGEIVEVDEEGVVVRASDAIVRLSSLLDADDRQVPMDELAKRCGLESGLVLERESGANAR